MSDQTTTAKWSIAPSFIVEDVMATANFYRDMLGFHYDRFWGEPPSFCMVYRNGIVIMLGCIEQRGWMRPNGKIDPNGREYGWDAYIWIDNADALYSEYKSKNVNIMRDICDQEYGCRDFEIEDCNGFRLCFGQNLK